MMNKVSPLTQDWIDENKLSKSFLRDHREVNLMNEEMAKILNAEIKSNYHVTFRKWWAVQRKWWIGMRNPQIVRWTRMIEKTGREGKIWLQGWDLKTCGGSAAKEWVDQRANGLDKNHLLRTRQLQSLNNWAGK